MNYSKFFRPALLLLLACLGTPVRADPNDYVLTLDYTEGEREIDAKLGAASHSAAGAPAAQAGALSWGTGLSADWFAEFYAQFSNRVVSAASSGFDSLSWENRVRFADPGQWPVDLGAVIEIERTHGTGQSWSLTAGPMLQGDIEDFQLNGNILFQRMIDAPRYQPTQIGYQFQVKYRAAERFEYGIQGFGSVGTWDHWGEPGPQSHRIGPAVFGRYRLGAGRAFSYNAALLLGTSSGAPLQTLRAELEYEY